MNECDSQSCSILKGQQKLQHKLIDIKLDRKKMENEVKQMETEKKDCSTKVDKLIEKLAWIATERQIFGRGGTDYDFHPVIHLKKGKNLTSFKLNNQGYLRVLLLSNSQVNRMLKMYSFWGIFFRSEQDREPEHETVSEAAGPGPVEESVADTSLEKYGFWDEVKATKWSERKEAVAELTKLASTNLHYAARL